MEEPQCLAPLVSVIVPCRNESAFIERCLDSILRNGYPPNRLEVLVVDGRSEDGTRAVLDRYAVHYPCMRIIENPRIGTPNALNLALAQARGPYVLRVDAHSSLAPGYIHSCVEALALYGADAVGGIMRAVPTMRTYVGRSIVAAISHPFGVGNSYFRIHTKDPKWVDTIFCGCYRREVFDRLQNSVGCLSGRASEAATTIDTAGPFNDRLARGQDMELHRRLQKMGGKMLLLPATSSTYYMRSDLTFFLSQSWNNGLWAVLPFAYCHGVPVAMRHLIPLGFVASVLLTAAIGFVTPASFLVCGAILSAYGTANIAASLQVGWRERSLAMVFVVPMIFVMLHIGYGVGSLWGAVTMACRGGVWRKIRRIDTRRQPAIEP